MKISIKKTRNPVMKFLGGKRGIAVIAGGVVAALLTGGVINPLTAELLGVGIAALGGAGIVHANIRDK